MKALLLITLAAISLATSACTTTGSSNYYLPLPPLPIPQRIETARPYSYNTYDNCAPRYRRETTYFVGPQYYRTSVPYFRGNIRNYTDAPIIAPSACNPHTNIIIPNSWN